jgi:hypothetical protein
MSVSHIMELSSNPTDAEIDEWNRRQEFVRDASPNRWIDYSLELQDAASSLWGLRSDRMELALQHGGDTPDMVSHGLANPRAYVLLAGFALENSLKAQLIVEQPTLITDAKLHKPLKTHSLISLMDRIKKLAFSQPERAIAGICESAIPYWGRYPVPLKYAEVENEYRVNVQFHAKFVALNGRVRKAVYDAIKDGWDSGVGPKLAKLRSKEFDDDLELDTPFPWSSDETTST